MADDLGAKQGMDRRKFFQTAAGMAASFVAMNEVYGPLFDVSKAEAATPAMAQERASALKDQFIMDMHTHFLRDDTRIMTFVNMRTAVGKAGWNKELGSREQTIEDLKFNNYKKEMFLDSDTKISLISSAPSDIEQDWFLTNEQMAEARKKINDEAGSRRVFSHMIFTPGQPGWLEKLDAGLALKPESCKGYTVGDNTHKEISRYPWRMDDEKVAYKGYEKMVKAGIKNVCVHKGLFAPGIEKQYPNLRGFADVADVGQAAKDWPQLNFVVYHSAYRHVGGDPKQALAEFERTGRISWTSDLADIPAQYGVNNVYGDVGQLFATTLVAEPNVCAALMGTLIKGLGRRPCLLGHRRAVDRRAAMADRRPAPARNPGSDAEEIRLRPARRRRRPGQDRDLRRQQCAALQHPAQARDAGAEGRPLRADEGGIREGGTGAVQHSLWLCGAERRGGSQRVCVSVVIRCPGRGAAFFMPLRRAGTVPSPEFVTAPALQRTARKGYALRCVRGTTTYFGSGCTGSTHSTVSGFSTGSMSRLIATAWPSLRTSTHSSTSSRLALISWCGT